jgi:hypothetical protein
VLESEPSRLKVSTGIAALDVALDGLYWGDNVVWDLDAASAQPFYSAIARLSEAFDTRGFISLSRGGDQVDVPGLTVIEAGPGTALPQPADLLREIQRLCQPPSRRLLLFESLDGMVGAWGANSTRGFFARCCPLLLEVGAIAYWTMSAAGRPPRCATRSRR